jgi:hypothetical protein
MENVDLIPRTTITLATEPEHLKGYKPRNKRIVVAIDKPPEKIGELYMPGTGPQTTSTGTVIASDSEMAEVGDRVSYVQFFPMRVEMVDFFWCHETHLVLVQRKEDKPSAIAE